MISALRSELLPCFCNQAEFARSENLWQQARTLIGETAYSLPETVALLEKRLIAETLARTHHHIGKTSALLNVPRRTLQRKIKAYDL